MACLRVANVQRDQGVGGAAARTDLIRPARSPFDLCRQPATQSRSHGLHYDPQLRGLRRRLNVLARYIIITRITIIINTYFTAHPSQLERSRYKSKTGDIKSVQRTSKSKQNKAASAMCLLRIQRVMQLKPTSSAKADIGLQILIHQLVASLTMISPRWIDKISSRRAAISGAWERFSVAQGHPRGSNNGFF